MSRQQLYSRERVSRTLNRLASEVVERNRGVDRLTVVGIQRRGAALASGMAERLGAMTGQALDSYPLDVSAFRDDRAAEPAAHASGVELDLANRDVLLVDDVLYTGRTVRAALDALVRYGRPRSIQLVVLVDRGHREYPIQADYVGHVIPTDYRARVAVEVAEGFAIYLEE